jgi:hypothetical protein
VEWDLKLQEMPKSILIPHKNIKKKEVVISCTYTHPFKCVVRFYFILKKFKNLEKKKKEKENIESQANPLTCQSHIFKYWAL